jgi:hypothetical protein
VSNSSSNCSRRAKGIFTRPSTSVLKIVSSVGVIFIVLQDVEAKGSRRASRIKTLNRKIKGMAEKRKITVKLVSGNRLRSLLLGNPKGTKQEMAEKIAMQFPDELASRLPPKRKLWKSEDGRMDIFDAVVLAAAFQVIGK